MFAAKRLGKLQEGLPPGISLVKAEDFEEWEMDVKVMDDNPIYKGDTYRLKFKFSNSYPIEAPEVTFILAPAAGITKIPMHPHIYSNGIICLDLLDRQGWSPVHNVQSVCISLQSMLTGNTQNERPPGDEEFVRRNTQRPRDVNFYFHDDRV
ncbi:ubiquitin conjugating enzyme [Saccharata proteae CBS 121410]|uniref:Ubiquitin conjugating enzyme n=1 Tax=Saccharata proteae CBS 121410 TaxID=1314787 RepID=A0A9P4HWR3_9PEZI|nr:ubiquitin conjugating enzyme [Saccharata proteae CBS 121410]